MFNGILPAPPGLFGDDFSLTSPNVALGSSREGAIFLSAGWLIMVDHAAKTLMNKVMDVSA